MVTVNTRDGNKVELEVIELNPRERARILKTHLKVKEFMNASKDKTKESSIFDYLKDEDGAFEFINDVLISGVKGLKLEDITASEADRLSGVVIADILGLNSKN